MHSNNLGRSSNFDMLAATLNQPINFGSIQRLLASRSILTMIDQVIYSASNFLTAVIVARNCSAQQFGLYILGLRLVDYSREIQNVTCVKSIDLAIRLRLFAQKSCQRGPARPDHGILVRTAGIRKETVPLRVVPRARFAGLRQGYVAPENLGCFPALPIEGAPIFSQQVLSNGCRAAAKSVALAGANLCR